MKTSLSQVLDALKMPEIYMVILFYIMSGITAPCFCEFLYFFHLNVIQFTKFEIAMFNVLGYLSLSLGTMYFNIYLKDYEVRTLLKYASYIGVFGSIFLLV